MISCFHKPSCTCATCPISPTLFLPTLSLPDAFSSTRQATRLLPLLFPPPPAVESKRLLRPNPHHRVLHGEAPIRGGCNGGRRCCRRRIIRHRGRIVLRRSSPLRRRAALQNPPVAAACFIAATASPPHCDGAPTSGGRCSATPSLAPSGCCSGARHAMPVRAAAKHRRRRRVLRWSIDGPPLGRCRRCSDAPQATEGAAMERRGRDH